MPPSDPSTAAYSNQLGVGSDNHAGAGNGGSADVTTKGAPTDLLQCDICIIGAGSGGLSVAAGAATGVCRLKH